MTPINDKIETPDKANSQFEAGVRFAMSLVRSRLSGHGPANYMLGLDHRAMPDRIRNREGLATAGRDCRFPRGQLGGTQRHREQNPANCPKVEFSFLDELKKTLASGFTADEVATAKKAYLDAQMVTLAGHGARHPAGAARATRPHDEVGFRAGNEDRRSDSGANLRRFPTPHRPRRGLNREGRRFRRRESISLRLPA